MPQAVKTFGVKEATHLSSQLDAHAEEIRILGYTVLPDVLSPAEVKKAQDSLERVYQTQLDEIGGQQNLAAIGDTFTAMCPLAYDEFFLSLVTNRQVLQLVEKLLGDYFILMLQNGILNMPQIGSSQTSGHWHRDIGYQHFTSSRPLGVTALYCLDEFNDETGGTRVLPGSHKIESFPSEEFVSNHEHGMSAPAGSVILIDSMLYHRGGHNRSRNVRRAVNNVYTLPLVKQQISVFNALNGRYKDDPFLSRLLGYDSETDESVGAFRQKRLQRKGAAKTEAKAK